MQDYALTDVGKVRTRNQDYLYSSSNPIGDLENLYMVADGMGGHRAGDYASRFLVERLVLFIGKNHEGDPVRILKEGLRQANREIFDKARNNPELSGMGTTLVAATVKNNTLITANVGDSRLYLCRSGELSQITKDHSYVEEMVAMGRMTRGSRDYLDKKNIITRAVGTDRTVEADFFRTELKPGDLFLLCSDGLSNMLSDKDIQSILRNGEPLKNKAEELVNSANRKGGRDNIAVILVDPQISEVGVC